MKQVKTNGSINSPAEIPTLIGALRRQGAYKAPNTRKAASSLERAAFCV